MVGSLGGVRVKRLAGVLLVFLMLPSLTAQPDVGTAIEPVDAILGDAIPPTLDTLYTALGQNITREDVRLFLDINITKGGVGVLGLLLGSGKAEVEATIHIRGEMRVISSERIYAAVSGDNAYNISAENATFLSEVYLPAEVFRATLSAEVIAAFQAEQERALRDYVSDMVPELEVLRLDISWDNVHVFDALSDTSLTEPPIVIELEATARYLRVESVPSLLNEYLGRDRPPTDPDKEYIERLKQENSDPLRARDFFAAAAFSQLLNLSMQPGWSLDVRVAVPRGYSIEYASRDIDLIDERHARFSVDALEADDDVQEVLVYSVTHRKAVIVALLVVLFAGVAVLNIPGRWAYSRFRLPRHRAKMATRS